MKSKYLDDLGIPKNKQFINFLESSDERIKEYNKTRKKYGVDPRETWCLDSIFAQWLYTRCKMYLKCAKGTVDLSFHKFTYKGKEYTQEEAIKKIISWTKFYILNKDGAADIETENKAYKKLKKACELWAVIIPAMWW